MFGALVESDEIEGALLIDTQQARRSAPHTAHPLSTQPLQQLPFYDVQPQFGCCWRAYASSPVPLSLPRAPPHVVCSPLSPSSSEHPAFRSRRSQWIAARRLSALISFHTGAQGGARA